jgi:hypothetical protein
MHFFFILIFSFSGVEFGASQPFRAVYGASLPFLFISETALDIHS